MQKLDGKTQAATMEDKIQKLKGIFPEVFTDSKIDLNKLLFALEAYMEEAHIPYELIWSGKQAAIVEAKASHAKKFIASKEKSLEWDTTKNMYIEGDNIEALRVLQSSHKDRIKMIYIDPPYNSGLDLIYNDNFNYHANGIMNNISARIHTNWLNFMYPRLMLARDLLTEDGMIFISIGEKELYNLKKICDEIYGEENFVTTLIWEKKKKPSFLDRNVGSVTEYIVVYSKRNEKTHALSIETTEIGKKYPFNNAGNPLRVLTFPKGSVHFRMTDRKVKAQDMSRGKIITKLLDDVMIKDGKNENDFRLLGEWRYSQQRLNNIINNREKIIISKVPFRPNHVKAGGETKKLKNLFTISGYGFPTYEDADKEITQLFGRKLFDYSKPEMLIRRLIQSLLYNDDKAIVLDFFSGSATTGEAVWKFNEEFGKNHRFILVQLPERIDRNSEAYKEGYLTISELGVERLKRSRGLLLEKGVSEGVDLGFKFFKLEEG